MPRLAVRHRIPTPVQAKTLGSNAEASSVPGQRRVHIIDFVGGISAVCIRPLQLIADASSSPFSGPWANTCDLSAFPQPPTDTVGYDRITTSPQQPAGFAAGRHPHRHRESSLAAPRLAYRTSRWEPRDPPRCCGRHVRRCATVRRGSIRRSGVRRIRRWVSRAGRDLGVPRHRRRQRRRKQGHWRW